MDNKDIDELYERLSNNKIDFNSIHDVIGKLSKEHLEAVMPVYSDLKNLQVMFESGNIDEKEVEKIKSKYGTETHK